MDRYDLDEESFRLLVQLQMEDIAEISSGTDGKDLTTLENDFVVAAEQYKRELEQHLLAFCPEPAGDCNLATVMPTDQAEVAVNPEPPREELETNFVDGKNAGPCSSAHAGMIIADNVW
ncbi:hypothetical protein E5D57_002645 [Metarhizium anisopliae]|nr:hypothetical protein E5D57_002645 [Metarhizium anisopliae]